MAAIVQIEQHISEQIRIACEVFGVMVDLIAEPST